jgi:hypothetical protein
VTASSDDAEESKPAPDVFEVVLKKLNIQGADAVAIGNTPYDAEAAAKAAIATIGVLCGGFPEKSLRQAGCVEIFRGPAALFARFQDSLLAKTSNSRTEVNSTLGTNHCPSPTDCSLSWPHPGGALCRPLTCP